MLTARTTTNFYATVCGAFGIFIAIAAGATEKELTAMLPPCPDKPNCVSSVDQTDASHYIAPIPYKGDLATAKAAVKQLILELPRTRVIAEDDVLLHVTFTSKIFGFVDDVQFYVDESEKLIHVRSASRSGYYDFGINRRRVDRIASMLSERFGK